MDVLPPQYIKKPPNRRWAVDLDGSLSVSKADIQSIPLRKAREGIWCCVYWLILVILQAAWVLAALCHPSHIVSYAPGDSIAGCLQATRII
ncbi:hypothetical protein C9426_05850 [Serratia sp. S1B]|nr:hypothetical protein C9426_05850 [Serratia sp. S1B]